MVAAPLAEWGEILELKGQGHTILTLPEDATPDIILGPTCWRMDEVIRSYLPLAIKAARIHKYGGTQGGTSSGE